MQPLLLLLGRFEGAGCAAGWFGQPGGVAVPARGSGRQPGTAWPECCCVNPCLPSARLAVDGAGLMGLVRGLQLISAVHAAPREQPGRITSSLGGGRAASVQ